MTHIVTWEEPEIHLDLSQMSDRLYQELNQELPIDIQYRKTGSLAIIEKPEGMASMVGLVERLQVRGMHCRMLSSLDLRELEPNLAPESGRWSPLRRRRSGQSVEHYPISGSPQSEPAGSCPD